MRAGLRLARAVALRRFAAGGDGTIDFFGQRDDLGRLDIAGDDENGVFGRIEAVVIGKRVGALEALDLMAPADDRLAIGMLGEKRRLHRLAQLVGGVGIGAHAALLLHDLALGRDDLVGEDEVLHAVRLIIHADGELARGDALEIGGVVVRGEGVLLAAGIGDELGEFALLVIFGALEHQMFEEMGDAGFAQWIVGRAVAVPDHVGDDGRAAVGDDDDVEAVGEPRLRRWRGRRARRREIPPKGSGRASGARRRARRRSGQGTSGSSLSKRFLLEVILASRWGRALCRA